MGWGGGGVVRGTEVWGEEWVRGGEEVGKEWSSEGNFG